MIDVDGSGGRIWLNLAWIANVYLGIDSCLRLSKHSCLAIFCLCIQIASHGIGSCHCLCANKWIKTYEMEILCSILFAFDGFSVNRFLFNENSELNICHFSFLIYLGMESKFFCMQRGNIHISLHYFHVNVEIWLTTNSNLMPI